MIGVLALSPAVDKIYFADNFHAGGLYRVKKVIKSPGGKGINVARMAAQLGEKVASAGFKAGAAGEWLEDSLRRLGVETLFIEVEGESRTNNNIIDRVSGTETEVLEAGPYIDGSAVERFLAAFRKLLPKCGILVCTGGLPEGLPVDFYRQLIEEAVLAGAEVILDSSGEVLAESLKAGPHLVKPNRRELGAFGGGRADTGEAVVEACRAMLSHGAGQVMASLGKDGAYLVSENAVLRARVPAIEAVNSIGSGDAAVAGYAAARHMGRTGEDALRLAMACAVSNTQFMEIGNVNKAQVEKYLAQIEIDYI